MSGTAFVMLKVIRLQPNGRHYPKPVAEGETVLLTQDAQQEGISLLIILWGQAGPSGILASSDPLKGQSSGHCVVDTAGGDPGSWMELDQEGFCAGQWVPYSLDDLLN